MRGGRVYKLSEFIRAAEGEVILDRRDHTAEIRLSAGSKALRTRACTALVKIMPNIFERSPTSTQGPTNHFERIEPPATYQRSPTTTQKPTSDSRGASHQSTSAVPPAHRDRKAIWREASPQQPTSTQGPTSDIERSEPPVYQRNPTSSCRP